jgi:EAL and modified HD-GYP domain-containing signal transduction protein
MAESRQYQAQRMATHVDTSEDFEFCQALGIGYFQGAFLGRAEMIARRRSPVNRPALLNLMTKLIDPSISFSELEDLIRRDITLCHNLLRLLSASALNPPKPVTSIGQMLQTIGLKALLTWVSLILLSGLDDPPHELVTTAMIRAQMCESLAKLTKQEAPKTFFLTGLISVLDALLDTTMSELTANLPLDETIQRALLDREGELGRLLDAVLAYESGNWDALDQLGIDSTVITDSYLQAVVWAEASTGLL